MDKTINLSLLAISLLVILLAVTLVFPRPIDPIPTDLQFGQDCGSLPYMQVMPPGSCNPSPPDKAPVDPPLPFPQ